MLEWKIAGKSNDPISKVKSNQMKQKDTPEWAQSPEKIKRSAWNKLQIWLKERFGHLPEIKATSTSKAKLKHSIDDSPTDRFSYEFPSFSQHS